MTTFNCFASLLLLTTHVVTSVNSQVFDRYGGYEPTTPITDYAAIDLDQEVLNEETGERILENAWQVYENGGHSGSYAELTITNVTSHFHYNAGTIVRGTDSFQNIVNATLLEAASWKTGDAEPIIKVLYDVLPIQSEYSDCQVGGLYTFAAAERGGCFLPAGTIRFEVTNGVTDKEFPYSYDNRASNKNIHTLQKLSTNASTTMKGPDGAYYPEFQHFVDYYGDANYGDKWINAARWKTNTAFTSKRGNSEFSVLKKRDGQGDAMKKGSAYLNIWMEVVRYLNLAVINCRDNVPGAAAVDKAVAYYAGSRTTEENSEGVLLYALAEIRAHQMKTGGHLEDKDVGDAFVNVDIFRHFTSMRDLLLSADPSVCDQVEQSKNHIVTMMKVPMIQSVLRYAYIQHKEPPTKQEDVDKMVAEGATFAATMLPFIHACESTGRAAEIVHKHMKLGVIANFEEVKKVMESTYSCLNVTCENVGGIWDQNDKAYKSLPCGVSDGRSPLANFSIFIGIGSAIALLAFLLMKYRHKITFLNKKRNKAMPPMYNTGNIAAVTEIA